jgi:hypothetical protein
MNASLSMRRAGQSKKMVEVRLSFEERKNISYLKMCIYFFGTADILYVYDVYIYIYIYSGICYNGGMLQRKAIINKVRMLQRNLRNVICRNSTRITCRAFPL